MNEELAPFSVCGPQKYLQGAMAITAQQLLKVQKKNYRMRPDLLLTHYCNHNVLRRDSKPVLQILYYLVAIIYSKKFPICSTAIRYNSQQSIVEKNST